MYTGNASPPGTPAHTREKNRKLDVVNPQGNIDAYVIRYDHEDFASHTIQKTFDALSEHRQGDAVHVG